MSDQEHPMTPPGSAAAIDKGCICPRLDNAGGLGYMGIRGHYVIVEGCPLHDLPISNRIPTFFPVPPTTPDVEEVDITIIP